jgi:prevent-host-death family protein
MIAVTDTQAARSFADILDAVEHGETVVIARNGVPVGRFVPDRRTWADRLKTALRDQLADAGFSDDLDSRSSGAGSTWMPSSALTMPLSRSAPKC